MKLGFLSFVLVVAMASGCGGTPVSTQTPTAGADGKNSLVNLTTEAPGAHCPNGGTAIQSGLDTNANGKLDAAEVTSTSYVCAVAGPPGADGYNGSSGKSTLARQAAEPAGNNCPSGGIAVKVGVDTNGNGVLDDSEVTSTSYVCNGRNGNLGTSGATTLVRQDVEPAGAHCPAGGVAVKSGIDANGNGTLEDAEVTTTSYVCNGAAGDAGAQGPAGSSGPAGAQSLVTLTPEPAGPNCPFGGTLVKNGLDTNANGTLDAAEVTQSQYVCSSANLYPTKWAKSQPGFGSNYPFSGWVPSGRTVTIYKQNLASRLKVTVNDNFRVGQPNPAAPSVNPGSGYYAVKMNGGSWIPGCYLGQFTWNSSAWNQNFHLPLGDVCMTDALPQGLYTFDTWVYAGSGDAYVGGDTSSMLLVEEVDSTTVATATGGADWTTMSPTFVQVPDRTASYTKKAANTLLKVTLSDDLRVGYNQNGGWGTVMIRQDGIDTPCYFGSYDVAGTNSDFHLPISSTCLLTGVAAGNHTYTVWASANSATTGNTGQLYMGWGRGGAGTLLVVEEVPSTNLAYKVINNSAATPTATAELSSQAYSAVPGRQVSYTPTGANKTVKVTFSDTFRNNYTCNGSWGSMQLYVDSTPTGCIMGKYSANAAAAEDHHQPFVMTCVVPNLSATAHIFEIWHRTTSSGGTNASACGTNFFGWTRGQVLLLVEELP